MLKMKKSIEQRRRLRRAALTSAMAAAYMGSLGTTAVKAQAVFREDFEGLTLQGQASKNPTLAVRSGRISRPLAGRRTIRKDAWRWKSGTQWYYRMGWLELRQQKLVVALCR